MARYKAEHSYHLQLLASLMIPSIFCSQWLCSVQTAAIWKFELT